MGEANISLPVTWFCSGFRDILLREKGGTELRDKGTNFKIIAIVQGLQ